MNAKIISQILDQYLPPHHTEYRFHEVRKWRFDLAWPQHKVAVEIDGGIFSGGRHSRGAGMLKDMEKRNTATVAGWRVLNFTPQSIVKTESINMISDLLAL